MSVRTQLRRKIKPSTVGCAYNSRLQKGGALLEDMRLLVRHWQNTATNGQQDIVVAENLLGKHTRARAADTLRYAFLPRFIKGRPHLPFAILHYDHASEFAARKQMSLLATRLQNAGKRVHVISIARILWAAIHDTEGIEAIAEEEQQFGFARTQETVSTLVSDSVFRPLPDQVEW